MLKLRASDIFQERFLFYATFCGIFESLALKSRLSKIAFPLILQLSRRTLLWSVSSRRHCAKMCHRVCVSATPTCHEQFSHTIHLQVSGIHDSSLHRSSNDAVSSQDGAPRDNGRRTNFRTSSHCQHDPKKLDKRNVKRRK